MLNGVSAARRNCEKPASRAQFDFAGLRAESDVLQSLAVGSTIIEVSSFVSICRTFCPALAG
jgi:hypothetical protein